MINLILLIKFFPNQIMIIKLISNQIEVQREFVY